jgi:hypothetical protein
MVGNQKPSGFFIQDPFTEEVKGPLTAQQLRNWFAQGQVGNWGVSKSPDGPWTPAAKVKGLGDSIPPPPRPAPASGHLGESRGVVKTAQSQNSGLGRRTPEYEGDPDSWGGLVRDVFSAIATKWREGKPKERSVGLGKLVRGVVILGLLGVGVFLGIGLFAGSGAGVGVSGASELGQKPGEADGVYRNRIANEVLVGVWRAEKDNSKPVVMPDGSSLALHEEQLVLKPQPSQTEHGFFYDLADYDGGGIKPPTSLVVVYGWELVSIKSSFFGGLVARVQYRPTEGPDFPEYQPGWPTYDLAALRLKQARSVDRPVLEFVLKDKDTLIQKNAAGFEPPFISFGDKVWHRVR